MDSSLIQNLFNFMTNNIFYIIYGFALVEVYLVISVFRMMRDHGKVLADVSDNLLKGFSDAPDKDSTQSIHEKIESWVSSTDRRFDKTYNEIHKINETVGVSKKSY